VKNIFQFLALLLMPLAAFAVDVQISQFTEDTGFDPAIRAGEIVYVTKVINGSADTAENTLLVFPIPATAVFDSVNDGRCVHDGGAPGQVNCTLGDLVGNGLGGPTTTIKFTIKTTAATGPTIDVGVTITADGDTNIAQVGGNNNYESQNTTIDDGADLVTTISDTGAVITAGANVTYTVSINNQGPNASATTTVTNTLPADVTFVSASGGGWSCGSAGQIVTCTRSSIANGATAPNITIVGKVTGKVAGAAINVTGTITDSVTVSSITGDPNPNNNTQTEDTDVVAGADLAIVKTVNPNPAIGNAAAVFTLAVTNNGPFDVDGARVIDNLLPSGFTFVSAPPVGSWTCSEVGQLVTCNNAAPFIAGTTQNILITATAPVSGVFSNAATISNTSGMPDPDASNDSSTIAGVGIVPNGADIAIAKSKTPNPVAQGSPMVSTITVTNNGPLATTGILTVTEVLNGETYVSSVGSGGGWACGAPAGVALNQTITCTYATDLALDETTTDLIINTTATNAGVLSNTASVTDVGGLEDAGVLGNNTVTVGGSSTNLIADLALTKTADAGGNSELALLEDTITYTLTLTSLAGSKDLTAIGGNNAIVITDTVPNYASAVVGAAPDTTAVAMTAVDPKFTCTIVAALVTCKLIDGKTFSAGETARFSFTATRPFLSGNHLNTASVISEVLGDDDPSNNISNETTITVAAAADVADIEVTAKTATPATVKAGVNTTYVISLRNNGPAEALNVKLRDIFAATAPVGKTFTVISAAASNGAACDAFGTGIGGANALDCDFGTLARNATRTVTMVIRPDWDVANVGWTMDNTATATTDTDQGANAAADFKTTTLTVEPAELDLLINNDEEAGFHEIGYTPAPGAFPGTMDNIIIYKEVITNRGPSFATGVKLDFLMTPKVGKTLKFLCDDAAAAGCLIGTSTCDNTDTNIVGGATLALNCPQPAGMASNTTLVRYLYFRVDSTPDGTGDTHSTLATISANEDDTVAGNNSEGEDTVVRALVDVGVTKAPSQPTVSVFEPFNWDLVISSNGPGDAPFTDLTDTLPAGMELTGSPVPSAGSCTGLAGETTFECNFGTLANGDTRTVTVPVRLTVFPAGGTITNTAFVTTFGIDRDPSNDSDPGTVTVQKSSIAGTVYSDFNDDGLQNGVESGILNVSLRLTGTDLYGNAVDTTVTTNASGAYLFDDLAPSGAAGYTITETQPANFTDGLESVLNVVKAGSRSSDQHTSISLAVNTALVEYDFGEIPQPGISGLVWGDTNNDGVLDADETVRISGVTITLTGTDNLGDPVNRVLVTDVNGQYNFINLLPSNGVGYTITETHPPAWRDGQEALGTVNGVPTGVVAADSFTGIIVPLAQAGVGYNFGEIGGSLAGKVYRDLNNDGVVDGGETGIENVTLRLTGTDSDGQSIARITTTDVNGDYIFTSLPASDGAGYTVKETQPAGIFDGKDTDGSLANGDVSVNDINSSIEFLNTDVATDYNFGEGGNIPTTSSIAGTVFVDSNDNGIQEGDEPGIESITLTLTGIDEDGNPVEVSVQTNANGDYLFSNIPPDNGDGYTITETHPTLYADGLDSIENVVKEGSKLTDTLHIDSLPAGSFLTDYDFGELEATAIPGVGLQGFVYADISAGGRNNGQKEAGEQGIANITVTLSGLTDGGVDVCTFRNCITKTSASGFFNFSDIPPGIYTLVETHTDLPRATDGSLLFTDGKETAGIAGGDAEATFGSQPYQNTIANIVITEALIGSSQGIIDGYLFGELNSEVLGLIPPIISGYVYMDRKGVRVRPTGDSLEGQVNWTAILFQNGVEICRILTNDDGFYQFDNLHCPGHEAGLPTGTGFDIAFRKDGNFLSNEAFSGGDAGQVLGSQIKGITLRSADNITEQNLPLDPSGVVYDSLTRVPVAGAEVTLTGPSGFDPSTHLVGATPVQITGSDGLYSFFLQNNFPSGVYTLEITRYPDGYIPAPSEIIPVCVAGTNGVPLNVGATPVPGLVQISSREPALTVPLHNPAACEGMVQGGSNSTQYYFEFVVTNGVSAPILTNHIPIDPFVTDGGIVMTKTTPRKEVYRGDLVPYTLVATNTSGRVLTNVAIRDQLPVGFKYIEDSATVNGVAIEPTIDGRLLTWSGADLAVDEARVISLITIVGAGVSEGKYVNETWAINAASELTLSNVAVATVRLVPDPLFDCSDLIGKVFDDKNINGYQDEGEPGLAGVRVVTPRGLLITTDDYGRFHIACADVPNELHGSNFLMKLDTRTLPSGYRVTTENPRVVRLTRGKLVKLNFGAALHRVLRIDIDRTAFSEDGEKLTAVASNQLDELIDIMKQQPSQVRLSYGLADGEEKSNAQAKMQVFTEQLEQLWQQCDCSNYALTVEQEVIMHDGDTAVWSTDGRVSP